MLRRRKGKKPQDPRRAQLIQVVRSAEIPLHFKTVALLAVAKMPIDQVGELLDLLAELIPMAESGDRAGIEALLKGKGISDELIGTAMSYYDQILPSPPKGPGAGG